MMTLEVLLSAVAFVLVHGMPSPEAQVDREWLRLWTDAQKGRPAELDSTAAVAPAGEPGTPMIVEGQVFEPDGKTPAADVTVFAYQTDRNGEYFGPAGSSRGWRLRGWARTDREGRFELTTIRPGAYPTRTEPAHIHVTLESSRYGRQWTPSILFADDELVSAAQRATSAVSGRFGQVRDVQVAAGVMRVQVFLKLKTHPDF